MPDFRLAPTRPRLIPPQETVLILSASRQRQEQNPLSEPAGFGGDGEHMGG
jgi:hypothetical protein